MYQCCIKKISFMHWSLQEKKKKKKKELPAVSEVFIQDSRLGPEAKLVQLNLPILLQQSHKFISISAFRLEHSSQT